MTNVKEIKGIPRPKHPTDETRSADKFSIGCNMARLAANPKSYLLSDTTYRASSLLGSEHF